MRNKTLVAGFLGRALVALLAVTVFVPALRAQTSERRVDNRVLLIFDTSSAMKKREPEEERGIKRLFALTLSSQMHEGDSIGVWTFDENLHMGEFQLQHWRAEDINVISSNIITFIHKHHYSKTTSFEKLMPELNEVMAGSPRLTTLIFCDGETPIRGTPVDDSINEIFKKNEVPMRKDREPYVLVFRTERGNYVGSTINTAVSINVPQFPLPPAPPPPPVAETPVPQSTVPPLIIIGRAVGTNPPTPAPAPAPQQQQTPPPPAAVVTSNAAPLSAAPLIMVMSPPPLHPLTNTPAPETNPAPAVVEAAPTNAAPPPEVVSPPPPPPPLASATTNYVTATATAIPRGVLPGIAGGIFVIVVAGVYMISRRSRRRNSPSLITESLKKK